MTIRTGFPTKGKAEGSITVDLEDWRCALDPSHSQDYRRRPEIDRDYLIEATEGLLRDLDSHEAKATFFILGEVASAVPEVVELVAHRGHEVASHSPVHLPPRMIPRNELRRMISNDVATIEEITGSRPIGFRAPYFGVRRDEGWILSLVSEAGFVYDSSIVPTWTPYWGIPRAPKAPYFPDLEDLSRSRTGGPMLEIPVSVWPTWGFAPGLPMGGGFYMRAWPTELLLRMMRMNVRNGHPLVLYIHPGNLDSDKEQLGSITVRDKLSQYLGSSRGHDVFERVLSEFKFDTLLNTFSSHIDSLVRRGHE